MRCVPPIESEDALKEEFQSANEEILPANEELQSTNEELETSREELQSTNEELNTLNDELRNRNLELGQANNDLTNLLDAIRIPILLIGADLRIDALPPSRRTFSTCGHPTWDGRSPTSETIFRCRIWQADPALRSPL